ncbi:pseudouridine synthase [Niveibacterium sp. SC-1]|uniref:pseudouridine synthase n=1 Tax=Niveibacterium sp. SC-1 TaxID=3135646 RepID=UPI00311D41A9
MLEILYRDDWLIAIHKPAGLLVHRSELDRRETRFAVQLLRDQIGRRVQPVHRLDRGTSGVLLFAFEGDIAAALGHQFESQAVDKRYLAIVRGWPAEAGRIDHPLRVVRDPYERAADDEVPAQAALTRFRRLASVELPIAVDRYPASRYALLALAPESGRRHQLRRHLKHISHPIIGDATYGKGAHNRMFGEHFGSERLLLANLGLRFTHPVSGEVVSVTAPPAEDFRRVVAALGWSDVNCVPDFIWGD